MSKAKAEITIFEQLTHKAMEAATLGKWDSVAHFYDRRTNAGSLEGLPRDVAKKLMHIDQWIITRIRDVQTLIQDQLGEAQQHRRRLEGLRRQWGNQSAVHVSHHFSV